MKKTSVRKPRATPRSGARRAHGPHIGDLIADLSSICGTPAREDSVRQRIVGEISGRVHHIETSPLGAVHAIIGPERKPRLMFAAHMDEVGVIISHVDPTGFARFGLLGRKDAASLVGHAVRFSGGRIAVIRLEAGAKRASISVDDLLLDFGSPEGGQATIGLGEVGCLESGGHRLGDRFVASNAGGRSGVAALIRTILSIGSPSAELQFVFSVQGEFGGDGGLTSAATLGPQGACVVCPAPTEDVPCRAGHSIHLGGGPVIAIRHGPTPADPRFVGRLASLAKKSKIRYQLGTFAEDLPGSALPAAGGGVTTAWLCIPCRGLGTTAEMVDLADVDGTVRLLTALGESQLEWM
jgi:putative aminopeptidase FrvX